MNEWQGARAPGAGPRLTVRALSASVNASPWPGITMSACGQDPLPVELEHLVVRGNRVDDRCPVRSPPEVGQRVDPVLGVDDKGGVFLGVTGRQPELRVRRHVPAVATVIEPEVVPVTRPEVDDLGVREERDVHRVVRVVMAQEDVGDRLGLDAEGRQRVEDVRA